VNFGKKARRVAGGLIPKICCGSAIGASLINRFLADVEGMQEQMGQYVEKFRKITSLLTNLSGVNKTK